MRRLKFQTKLILCNMLTILLVTACVMGVFFWYLVGNVSSRAADGFETLSARTAAQYDALIYNMDRTALQIAANPNVVATFSGIRPDGSANYFIREPLDDSRMVKLLISYNFKRDGNTRICLYNDDSDFVYTATTMTTGSAIQSFFDSGTFREIQDYFRGGDVYSLYLPPRQDILNDSGLPSPGYFSIIREIKDYSSGSQKCGYVEVQQSVQRMDAIFSDADDPFYAAVLGRDGAVHYQSPSLTACGDEGVLRTVDLARGGGIPTGFHTGGGQYTGLYPLREAGLDVLFIRQSGDVIAPLIQFGVILLAAYAIILATALVIENLLVRKLSRPLAELNKSIRNVSIDNLRLELDAGEKDDELQRLNMAFNQMLSHLRLAIDRQISSRTNELKSHLFALQSQMNPHFIYNILAIISMEASADGNGKIERICSRLSRMLSFSASMGNGFCPLEKELLHADNYLVLMQERYEVLFEYDIACEESVRGAQVPKLLVQPICENCFKHAFKHMEPVWRIHVEAYAEEGRWFVRITDNGPGFSEGFLREYEALCAGITMDNVSEKLGEIGIGGLCIPNILMRLKICYGDGGVCRIRNTAQGAEVTLGGGIIDDTGTACGG